MREYGVEKERRGRLSKPRMRSVAAYAFQSLRLRFGRSLVTSACVIGAIAFLAYNALALNPRPASDIEDSASGIEHPAAGADQDFFAGLEQFTREKNAFQKRMLVIVLSLFVAFVGITNSMLMSIKERYREIATLKCLGALNAYVRDVFMLEAFIQGGVGSVLGLALGSALHLLARPDQVSPGWVLLVGAGCLILGAVMTLLAAIWPIRAALAMLPIQALRVEE